MRATCNNNIFPVEGAVRITAVFTCRRPANKIWKTKDMPPYPKTTRPDVDNYAKCVLDALNGLAYRDDSQVVDLHVVKWVAAGNESPNTVILIYEDDYE